VDGVDTGVFITGGTAANFRRWSNFSISLNGLTTGVEHSLEFRVLNFDGPTGLRVEHFLPEPNTLASVGTGMLALVLIGSRRRRSI
jgi:hypothetical protein